MSANVVVSGLGCLTDIDSELRNTLGIGAPWRVVSACGSSRFVRPCVLLKVPLTTISSNEGMVWRWEPPVPTSISVKSAIIIAFSLIHYRR